MKNSWWKTANRWWIISDSEHRFASFGCWDWILTFSWSRGDVVSPYEIYLHYFDTLVHPDDCLRKWKLPDKRKYKDCHFPLTNVWHWGVAVGFFLFFFIIILWNCGWLVCFLVCSVYHFLSLWIISKMYCKKVTEFRSVTLCLTLEDGSNQIHFSAIWFKKNKEKNKVRYLRLPKPFLYSAQVRLKLTEPLSRCWITVHPPPYDSMSQKTSKVPLRGSGVTPYTPFFLVSSAL